MKVEKRRVDLVKAAYFLYMILVLFAPALNMERIFQILGIILIGAQLLCHHSYVSVFAIKRIMMYIFLVIYTGVLTIRSKTSMYYPFLFINFIILFLAFLLLEGKIETEKIISFLTVLCLLNVIVTILQFFDLSGTRYFSESLLNDRVYYLIESGQTYRTNGLSLGFDINGILCAITVEMLAIRLRFMKPSKVMAFLIWLGIVFSSIAVFISARVGIVALSLIVFLNIPKKSRKLYIFVCLICVGVFFWLLINKEFIINLFGDNEELLGIYSYLTEITDNFIGSGKIQADSLEELKTFYFMPDSFLHTILGDGIANHLRPVGYSDVGYIQMIFGIGLLGMTVYIVNLFLMGSCKDDEASKAVMHLRKSLFIILVITSFKGPYILSSVILNIYIVICATCIGDTIQSQSERL